MQGLFKLGITGTRQELQRFLKTVPEDPQLSLLEGFKDTDIQPFSGRCKLVWDSGGPGNISGLEGIADAISRAVPELEVMLLTQVLGLGDYHWFVYYSPAGQPEPSERIGQLDKGEIGVSVSLDELLDKKEILDEYGGLSDHDCQAVLGLDLEDVLRSCGDTGDGDEPLTREDLEAFIADVQDTEAVIDRGCAACCALSEYLERKARDIPYTIDGNGLPPVEYIFDLFSGCWR